MSLSTKSSSSSLQKLYAEAREAVPLQNFANLTLATKPGGDNRSGLTSRPSPITDQSQSVYQELCGKSGFPSRPRIQNKLDKLGTEKQALQKEKRDLDIQWSPIKYQSEKTNDPKLLQDHESNTRIVSDQLTNTSTMEKYVSELKEKYPVVISIDAPIDPDVIEEELASKHLPISQNDQEKSAKACKDLLKYVSNYKIPYSREISPRSMSFASVEKNSLEEIKVAFPNTTKISSDPQYIGRWSHMRAPLSRDVFGQEVSLSNGDKFYAVIDRKYAQGDTKWNLRFITPDEHQKSVKSGVD